MYEKFTDVDIVDTLQAILDKNEYDNQDSFEFAKKYLGEYLKTEGSTQDLLFRYGYSLTALYKEPEVYVGYSYYNRDWAKDYIDVGEQAFLIKGRNENGELKGDIYHLDYPEHHQEVRNNQKPWDLVQLTFEDGEKIMLPREKYIDSEHMKKLRYKYGDIDKHDYYLDDSHTAEVMESINQYHQHIEDNSIEYSVEQYIQENFTNGPELSYDEMQF